MSAAIDEGSTLGPYEILTRLGAGGMATLYLGRREGAAGFARHVAIKVVHPHLASDLHFVRMFVDEAKLASRIHHPNVVQVEELGERDGAYYLVMPYVHGCSLAELLTTLSQQQRRLAPELSVWLAIQAAEGLHAAHETTDDRGQPLGVVHRDISPQNLLISDKGHVSLIDFGIAKARGREHRTVTGSLKGKFSYMSPEQALGRQIDRRTDIYALGIVLWEMLAMRRLFEGDTEIDVLDKVRAPKVPSLRSYADDISDALEEAVMRALAPSANDRPADALAFRQLLVDALPQASSMGASSMAEVMGAVMGEQLRAKGAELPQSVSGLWRPSATEHLSSVDPISEPGSHATVKPAGSATGNGKAKAKALRQLTRRSPLASFSAVASPNTNPPQRSSNSMDSVPPAPPPIGALAPRPPSDLAAGQASAGRRPQPADSLDLDNMPTQVHTPPPGSSAATKGPERPAGVPWLGFVAALALVAIGAVGLGFGLKLGQGDTLTDAERQAPNGKAVPGRAAAEPQAPAPPQAGPTPTPTAPEAAEPQAAPPAQQAQQPPPIYGAANAQPVRQILPAGETTKASASASARRKRRNARKRAAEREAAATSTASKNTTPPPAKPGSGAADKTAKQPAKAAGSAISVEIHDDGFGEDE